MVSAARSSRTAGARVGIAVSATELCAVTRHGSMGRAPVQRFALDRMNGENGATWPALADTLRELARAHGAGKLAVALMPSVVEIRQLELPPLRDADLRQLLTRSAARYFVSARTPQVVGAVSARGGAKGATATVVAAAAPARIVSAMYAAARDAGWEIESVSPAEGAWCAAFAALVPASVRGMSYLVVLQDDRTDLLRVDAGRLTGVRRFRPGAADEMLLAGAVSGVRDVVAIGRSELCNALGASLGARGIRLGVAAAGWLDRGESPDVLAAAFAGPTALPLLESEEVRSAHVVERTRAMRWAGAAALVLAVLAAGIELSGVHRELGAVQAERAALRPEVAATQVGRTSVETAFRQLATLAAAERGAARWSEVVAALSDKLDDEAYLTAFRGRGDSVVVDGLAVHAARAFDAVEKTRGLTGVRAAAPVRREAPSGGPALERFTIAAQLGVRTTVAPASAKVAP